MTKNCKTMDYLSLLNVTLRLHKEEQNSSVVQLLEILLESPNGLIQELDHPTTSSKEQSNQQLKATLYFLFGESLSKQLYYRRALRAYEQALLLNETGIRRTSKRSKTTSSTSNSDSTKSTITSFDDNDIKHRMYVCRFEMHEFKEARQILEQIPQHERSIKVLNSLANLYCQEKAYSKAKDVYLTILQREPLSIDIVLKLCKIRKLFVTCEEIIENIPDEIKTMYSWYPTWIQAQCCLHSPNSKLAIRHFNQLTSRFEKNASILTNLAEAYYHDGNFNEAIRVFKIAYNCDPLCFARIDSYAACLHKENQKRQLEDLSVLMGTRCVLEGEHFHEPWLVLAHYYASKDKKEPRALLFAQKAYQLNRNSIEALILLACLFLEKKDPSKATGYSLSAHSQAPYRYEVQRIICDAYLSSSKKAVALAYAKQAVADLGETARSYFIYADIMLKSVDQRRRGSARNCLERAVNIDSSYVPAVLAFADMLIEEKKIEEAIEILMKALPSNSTSPEIHRRLYACHTEKKDYDRALDHQHLALDFQPVGKNNKSNAKSNDLSGQQDETEPVLGFEADELVEGDSEVDESQLD